jgi:hypothetical protein
MSKPKKPKGVTKEVFAAAFVRQCRAAGIPDAYYDADGLSKAGFVPQHIKATFAQAGGYGSKPLPRDLLYSLIDSYTANVAAILERLQR